MNEAVPWFNWNLKSLGFHPPQHCPLRNCYFVCRVAQGVSECFSDHTPKRYIYCTVYGERQGPENMRHEEFGKGWK